MKTHLQSIISQLEQLIQRAHQSGNASGFINPADALCRQMEALEAPAEAIAPLLLLIEHSPDIDYGDPGPIGTFLELQYGKGYEEQLLGSLKRKPTLYALHLLYRLAQNKANSKQMMAIYSDKIREIAVYGTPEIQQQAMEYLEHLAEIYYETDDELKEMKKQMEMVEKMMEEADIQQEQKRKSLQEHEPPPPISNVSYNGISFKVITRQQAVAYLPTITDLY
ncbi:MAG TPA: hypothetical protein VFR70_03100, partial [Flavobacterium sp.]|nr:hypothetical protein [Flavobacterium sp.]